MRENGKVKRVNNKMKSGGNQRKYEENGKEEKGRRGNKGDLLNGLRTKK